MQESPKCKDGFFLKNRYIMFKNSNISATISDHNINHHATSPRLHLKPLSQWEVSSGDLELTRCKSTVKAICVGLANSANYPDQWSDATIIRCKLHCERVKLFVSLLGGAACAAVSRDFRSFLHIRFYQRVYGCQSSLDFVYISSELFLFPDLRQRRRWQITYALVVPPCDYQIRHLAVIPLVLCLVRQRPD